MRTVYEIYKCRYEFKHTLPIYTRYMFDRDMSFYNEGMNGDLIETFDNYDDAYIYFHNDALKLCHTTINSNNHLVQVENLVLTESIYDDDDFIQYNTLDDFIEEVFPCNLVDEYSEHIIHTILESGKKYNCYEIDAMIGDYYLDYCDNHGWQEYCGSRYTENEILSRVSDIVCDSLDIDRI